MLTETGTQWSRPKFTRILRFSSCGLVPVGLFGNADFRGGNGCPNVRIAEQTSQNVDVGDAQSVQVHSGEPDVTSVRRKWLGLGRIYSDTGFLVYYGHRTLYYRDERGTFVGYEDDLLFPTSLCLTNPMRQVPQSDKALIIERMLEALKWDGHPARSVH